MGFTTMAKPASFFSLEVYPRTTDGPDHEEEVVKLFFIAFGFGEVKPSTSLEPQGLFRFGEKLPQKVLLTHSKSLL